MICRSWLIVIECNRSNRCQCNSNSKSNRLKFCKCNSNSNRLKFLKCNSNSNRLPVIDYKSGLRIYKSGNLSDPKILNV